MEQKLHDLFGEGPLWMYVVILVLLAFLIPCAFGFEPNEIGSHALHAATVQTPAEQDTNIEPPTATANEDGNGRLPWVLGALAAIFVALWLWERVRHSLDKHLLEENVQANRTQAEVIAALRQDVKRRRRRILRQAAEIVALRAENERLCTRGTEYWLDAPEGKLYVRRAGDDKTMVIHTPAKIKLLTLDIEPPPVAVEQAAGNGAVVCGRPRPPALFGEELLD